MGHMETRNTYKILVANSECLFEEKGDGTTMLKRG